MAGGRFKTGHHHNPAEQTLRSATYSNKLDGSLRIANSAAAWRCPRIRLPTISSARITRNQGMVQGNSVPGEDSELRWHDLRHTFASRLVMASVPKFSWGPSGLKQLCVTHIWARPTCGRQWSACP